VYLSQLRQTIAGTIEHVRADSGGERQGGHRKHSERKMRDRPPGVDGVSGLLPNRTEDKGNHEHNRPLCDDNNVKSRACPRALVDAIHAQNDRVGGQHDADSGSGERHEFQYLLAGTPGPKVVDSHMVMAQNIAAALALVARYSFRAALDGSVSHVKVISALVISSPASGSPTINAACTASLPSDSTMATPWFPPDRGGPDYDKCRNRQTSWQAAFSRSEQKP
jgi:hypothetical protein